MDFTSTILVVADAYMCYDHWEEVIVKIWRKKSEQNNNKKKKRLKMGERQKSNFNLEI